MVDILFVWGVESNEPRYETFSQAGDRIKKPAGHTRWKNGDLIKSGVSLITVKHSCG